MTARSIHIDAIVKEENTTSVNTTTNHRIYREREFVREKASVRERERSSARERERESICERERPSARERDHPREREHKPTR
jgi:hypothetical protein